MKHEKRVTGYRWYKTNERYSGGDHYANLYCEFILGVENDAAREYDFQPTEYHLERLQKIRSQGESSKYLYGDYHSNPLTLRWLASKESFSKYGTIWFACQIESGEVSAIMVKLLSTLNKEGLHYDCTPETLQEILDKIGARCVKHTAETPYNSFVYCEPGRDFSTPWEPAEEIEPAPAIAD